MRNKKIKEQNKEPKLSKGKDMSKRKKNKAKIMHSIKKDTNQSCPSGKMNKQEQTQQKPWMKKNQGEGLKQYQDQG
jgi:hypothetical protein